MNDYFEKEISKCNGKAYKFVFPHEPTFEWNYLSVKKCLYLEGNNDFNEWLSTLKKRKVEGFILIDKAIYISRTYAK